MNKKRHKAKIPDAKSRTIDPEKGESTSTRTIDELVRRAKVSEFVLPETRELVRGIDLTDVSDEIIGNAFEEGIFIAE